MSKRLFVLLVVLMSLSLIGIIFVQAYHINNTVKNEEEQFTDKVKRVLSSTATTIEELEYKEYAFRFRELMAEKGVQVDTTDIRNLWIIQDDLNSNETLIYRNGILEENFKIPSFIDIGLDSINITRISNERETRISRKNSYDNFDGNSNAASLEVSPEALLLQSAQISRSKEVMFETAYKYMAKRSPIHLRVSRNDLSDLLSQKLKDNNIDITFEYSIYHKDLATKVQTENFELLQDISYGVPIFLDNNDESEYKLYVNFPKRNRFILSSIFEVGLTFAPSLINFLAYAIPLSTLLLS